MMSARERPAPAVSRLTPSSDASAPPIATFLKPARPPCELAVATVAGGGFAALPFRIRSQNIAHVLPSYHEEVVSWMRPCGAQTGREESAAPHLYLIHCKIH